MRAREEVVLQVSFGPAATPTLPAAVAFAAEHAEESSVSPLPVMKSREA